MLALTTDNYYTKEADREYLSCSQYDAFVDGCEAKAFAKLQGRFVEQPSEAFLVGNYFHSHFEGKKAHEAFCQANFDDIYKTKTIKGVTIITGKYKPFEVADAMIQMAESDPHIKQFIDMPGENEIIMSGKLFGQFPWKIRLDKYIPDKRLIIDWKTVANIQEVQWNQQLGQKVSFVENFKYLMRAAAYIEIEKQYTGKDIDPTFLLVCLSKQDPPDKDIFCLNHRQRLDLELEKMYKHLNRIQRIKSGEIKPKRCGACEYCRGTKKLSGINMYYVLEPANRPPREEDYAIPE